MVFPDVLVFAEGTKRLLSTVEVETGESVNPIEARAEWGVYSKLKVPLHLYVPPRASRRPSASATNTRSWSSELWTYTTSFDQVRFTLVHRSPDAPTVKVPAAAPKPRRRKPKPRREADASGEAETGREAEARGAKAKAEGRSQAGREAKACPSQAEGQSGQEDRRSRSKAPQKRAARPVPFLRLTRDRRGFENTFLMHADRPGDRPRLLYWYRTAPGIMLGRAAARRGRDPHHRRTASRHRFRLAGDPRACAR